jgi:predicted transcriptional regulator
MHANKGYGITAWDDKMLQERVDDLGNKRLIDDLGNGEYQISDKGINWEENKKPPL